VQEQTLDEIIAYFENQKKDLEDLRSEYVLLLKENELAISKATEMGEDAFSVFDPRASHTSFSSLAKLRDRQEELQVKLDDTQTSFDRVNSYLLCLKELSVRDDSFQEYVSSNKEKELAAISLQEEDRKRISRDLHDTSLQNLTYLSHKIDLAGMFIDQDPARAKLELSSIRNDLRKVSDDIRNTIHDIRPMSFDDIGFKDSVIHMLSGLNAKSIYLDTDIDDVSRDNIILINIYRILQEAMGNCMKYSNASKVSVSIKEEDNRLHIVFCDNGIGFSLEEVRKQSDSHFGIHFMEERVLLIGGTFHLESSKDNGTKIEFFV